MALIQIDTNLTTRQVVKIKEFLNDLLKTDLNISFTYDEFKGSREEVIILRQN